MSPSTPLEPMQYDRSPVNPSVDPNVISHGNNHPTSTGPPNTITLNTSQHAQASAAASGSATQGAGPPSRGSNSTGSQDEGIQCILSPVSGCPESFTSSHRCFRDFTSIKNHLNAHCTGQLSGAIPREFLRQYSYSVCNVCDKLIHTRYNGTCPRCRPSARTRVQMDAMRSRNSTLNNTGLINQHLPSAQTVSALPSLSEIHEHFVPTIRNIPMSLRRLWAQCLARALAQATWSNDVTAWTELQMLAKCTLCRPARGGKSHTSQRLAWTRNRLNRWLAGERAELWHDLPQYQRPRVKQYSNEANIKIRQDRCLSLASEGGFGNACKALVSPPPLLHTAETAERLKEKHPAATQPVDLSALGNPSNSLVPLADVDLVERSIQSFHRLSGGGPSGLRPIHLKNCLTTVHRDEVLERCTALVNLLAKGEAPNSLAPFLAGATLMALPKKDDGIRPVAVGEVLRRLTAKCLCSAYKEQASAFFFPLQIGVGHALGTEVGLETARQWGGRHKDNTSSVFAKIDFANAFNCVDRQAFLEQCRHHFPGMSQWAEWCYSSPSHLFFGNNIISSERGVQQGDPLGPFLFALALQPLLHRLNRGRSDQGLQLTYSYLDDLILAGEQ